MKMDRILVVEKGKIAAEGSHTDLLRGGGLYHTLWNIQAGGFIGDSEDAQPDIEDEGMGERDEPATQPPSK